MADTARDAIPANSTWEKWNAEFEIAKKARGFETWQNRAKQIIRRYRDERGSATTDGMYPGADGSRFNILWSNIQTLKPALLSKTPKPVVERRYLDRDDVGRTASVILERALNFELDEGCYKAALERAVLDRLLPGRGVVWVRYEPKFAPMEGAQPNATGPGTQGDKALVGNDATNPVDEQVASESTPVDYVDWMDFDTNPARTWEEVWWVRKRVYMSRKELVARFGKEIGGEVPLDWTAGEQAQPGSGVNPGTSTGGQGDGQKRARVLEIWDKTERKVYWMAEKWSNKMLDEKDDPLQLEGFWPVPKPLFATLTNETLIPVPDFYEYQDQAYELDDLTSRITALTKTIKACGVYDASVDELKRMFEEGFENQLVPCDNMAEFAAKAGPTGQGSIWLLPIRDQAEVLLQLYQAREQVKQSLYEITGISDIVRGQASQGAATTATEQRIKGQFASMRLNEMQNEVARFARDTLRIMGEIISEHFSPETLWLVSGFEQYAKEQWPPEPPQAPPAPAGMGHNGGPPMPPPSPNALPPQGAGGMTSAIPMSPPAIPPELAAQLKAKQMFDAAVALLKNDKLRGFRIDIETDSLVEPDQQQTQQARTELLGAISQFLPQAIEAGSAVPELKPLMARLLMFFLRGFKASRDIEAAFEQFIDDVTKQAANPQPAPPSPEEIKAQAEMKKQEMETQRMMMQAQVDQQKNQMDMAMMAEKHRMEMEKMQAELAMKAQELQLDQQRLQMEERSMVMKAQVDERTATIKSEQAERQAGMDMEAAEHQHELGMETMEAKAAASRKPASNGAAS